jgi:cytochrome c oxidase subunit 1
MPRRIYTYDAGMGWDFWNSFATMGANILAISMLLFIWNFFRTMRREPTAPPNPWDAATLEWATASPPPEHDFDVIPEVRSREPLWYDRDHGIEPPVPPEGAYIHMPPPSYYPIMIAIGTLLLALGPLTHMAISVLGPPVIIYAIWRWALEPTD